MIRSIIYTVDGAGTLTAMRPSEPRSENYMQKLVADHPELIADEDGDLLLIRREQPIADSAEGGARWSLDHLFVTRGGVPVLVELKRATDTRIRREVVGQMLDYASNATAYWQGGRIAESFRASMDRLSRDADAELETFLGPSADPQQFWDQVDANFSAGRIKMVFVADTIEPPLARIVEFLNEQMRADVRAVELSWFESQDGVTALTPRIIGETQRAQTQKAARGSLAPVEREDWIAKHLSEYGPETIAAANAYVATVETSGGRAEVTRTQGSIVAIFDAPDGTLYPLALTPSGKGAVQLCLGNLLSRSAFSDTESRRRLYDRLASIAGPLSTQNLSGFPSFGVTKLNDLAIRAAIAGFIDELRKMAQVA